MDQNKSKSRILIVEDNQINYLILRKIVTQFGVEDLWAKNGLDALSMLAAENDIALILMDIEMPLMDGITATKKIRETNTEIPIIFQTAFANEENRKACFKAGGNEFLCKPIQKELLMRLLEKYYH